jgi:hypothetical protein
MPNWEERITRETPPAVRLEHDLRYTLAAPLIDGAALWCDLGCGNGIAQAAALAGRRPQRMLLVDLDDDAAQRAARELDDQAQTMVADLSDPAALAAIVAALGAHAAAGAPRVITMFEVVEHLESFVALIETVQELAASGVDVLLSVPNDAFNAVENPHHRTIWGEGSVDELRGLLGPDAVFLRQVALNGSAIGSFDGELALGVDAEAAVPTHFIVALGPRATQLAAEAVIGQVDLDGQRAWESEREARASLVPKLLATNEELTLLVRQHFAWFEEWRTYIHQLETRLGDPLSGVSEGTRPPALEPEHVADA